MMYSWWILWNDLSKLFLIYLFSLYMEVPSSNNDNACYRIYGGLGYLHRRNIFGSIKFGSKKPIPMTWWFLVSIAVKLCHIINLRVSTTADRFYLSCISSRKVRHFSNVLSSVNMRKWLSVFHYINFITASRAPESQSNTQSCSNPGKAAKNYETRSIHLFARVKNN